MIHNENLKQQKEDEYYKCINSNKEILSKSSSGGAFTDIVNAILKVNEGKEYKIYGCYLDENLMAKHIGVENVDEIYKFRKSKYLQSDTKKTFMEAKKDLKENKIVIFTGTPCQIAGVRNYVGEKYSENLYTIDILCHGVPSQKVFSMYVKGVEKKYNRKISSINFREKMRIGNKIDSLGVKFEFKDGKKIKQYTFRNTYMLGFFKGLYYRPSCEICPFSEKRRVSDITIGDFWGIEKKHKKLDPNTGISLCIINTDKAMKLKKFLSENKNFSREDEDLAILNNRNLQKPSKISKNRDRFFEILNKTNDFEEAVKPFIRKKNRFLFFMSLNISDNIKNKIKRVLKRNED